MNESIEIILDHLLSVTAESEIVEFKEAKNQFDSNELGKYFSALSNEANLRGLESSWLVMGVSNTRKIVGTAYLSSLKLINECKASIAQHTTGRITFREIHEFIHPSGRILLFQIPNAPKGFPIAWKGHYYGRDGEQLNALNLEEIERIRSQSTKEDWSAGICHGATLNDLSKVAILQAREAFKKKNQNLASNVDEWDDVIFLNKAKILINGKVTRTAILLLGLPESEHFISPAIARISWILKNKDNEPKDYEHFTCPFLLSAQSVFNKIRILKYRYMQEHSLFPEEVDQYHPYLIREALNNCIAHQDYSLAGKINVIENENDCLVFSNQGSFIPRSIDAVIRANAPESIYRNPFLSNAMVNLNLIDTIGSGIRRMFTIQREKFFPLPEYDLDNERVEVTITGKILDLNYAKKLAQKPSLKLEDIILLDKVQKHKRLTDTEIKYLKKHKLIEGRKPNFHISSSVAAATGQQDTYMKMRGLDDSYYKKLIQEYLTKFGHGKRADFDNLLLDKLPSSLDEQQKLNKVKNILQDLKNQKVIKLSKNKTWILEQDS
ncbi:ATP-dependent DNA helicase RecG [Thiothrix eikelboomii]|uniref:ATP-dependent DNA helicase RecG n=1 Tax=Thiothrix eikelboomii TaxID=92487 RepID=A0A1T4XFM3_9GAMM|nr:RNA-binding domain-containing protein [Thiothrix eikelboomii]SKA88384.1 ATP-dependent DNA helicase RecG [Thiothrix eikelboomii]